MYHFILQSNENLGSLIVMKLLKMQKKSYLSYINRPHYLHINYIYFTQICS